jgi:Mu transposase, C-terminal./Integrase core domain.
MADGGQQQRAAAEPVAQLSYTAAEIARCIGVHRRKVQERANAQSWPYTEHQVIGGRQRRYALETLPADVRGSLVAREMRLHAVQRPAAPQALTSEQQQASLARLAQARPWEKTHAEPKVALWLAISEYQRRAAVTWAAAVAKYNAGDLQVSDEVRAEYPSLPEKTLEKWRAQVRGAGLAGLIPRYGLRRGQGVIDTHVRADGYALRTWVLGVMLNEPHIRAKHLNERLMIEWPEVEVAESTLRAWMTAWKQQNAATWLRHTNPDAWKSRYLPAFGSQTEAVVALNQLWEFDGSPADWMLTDGRHMVLQVVRVYSRERLFFVTRTATAEAYCLLLRRALLAWGVPETIRTDNGTDYVSHYATGVLRALEIEQELCDAYESQQKGVVERGFRTVFHSILQSLPGFVGHNVAERKAIESRASFQERREGKKIIHARMSGAELQAELDDWAALKYARDAQEALGGRSPFDVAAAWRGEIARPDERALDALLMPIQGTRTVGKKGIAFRNGRYIHPSLTVGQVVECKICPDELGRLYVYDLDGVFVCVAVDPDLMGVSRREVAVATHVAERRVRKALDADLRHAKRQIRKNTAQVVMDHRRETAGVVTALPKPARAHETPGLDQAGRAAQWSDVPQAPEPDAELQAITAEIQRDLASGRPMRVMPIRQRPITIEEQEADYRRRLEGLRARQARGEEISEQDAAWMGRVQERSWATCDARDVFQAAEARRASAM